MNPIYQTSSQLKEKARAQLEGNYGTAIVMQLLVQLISGMAGLVIAAFFPAASVFTYVIQLILTFAVSIIVGVCSVGVTLYYLNVACGGTKDLGNLWYGFSHQFQKHLILSLVITGFAFVYQTIIQLPLTLYTSTFDIKYLFLSLPITLIAIVAYFYVSLLFSPVFYLTLDYPTYSATEVLKLSPRIMKGHKKRLLYLLLSFLPLILLSLLTCGIGTFWVTAYQNMTMTNFYLDLMNPKKPSFDRQV